MLPTHDIERLMRGVLKRATDNTIIVSPLLWASSDGLAARKWFFIVITKPFYAVEVVLPSDEDEREKVRDGYIAGLIVKAKRPLVIHNMVDELSTARLAEALWPCAAATRVRESIEREQAGATP